MDKLLIITATFCLLLPFSQRALQADEATQASRRILLLTNGQILQGDVTLYGDRYLVTLPHSEVRIPVDQVEQICHSLEEVYQFLCKKVGFAPAVEHLALSQWCLDQGLKAAAQQQLDLAIGEQPDHPRIALIERQLEPATTGDGPVDGEATYRQPPASAEDLDAMVRGMPEGTMESFTRFVQPLLINGCSARACHGAAGGNDFVLRRISRGQLPPRRMTLRNLHSAMKWVDQNQPLESPLLRYATTPHGGKKQAPLMRAALPYTRLTNWVAKFLQETPLPSDTLAAAAPNDHLPPGRQAAPPAEPSLYNPDSPAETNSVHPNSGAGPSPGGRFRPKDPFDPQIFNRRYHPAKR